MSGYICFDAESFPIDGAAAYLEPATAPSNYVKPEAIAAYVEKANAEQLAKAALDVDLARIVALGVDTGDGPVVSVCRTEDEEREALIAFWLLVNAAGPRPNLIGFNCLAWDLPLLLRRSLYLDIKAPRIAFSKYRHDGIVDLMMALSFDGALRYRGLQFYKRRFALDVPDDPHSGADIGALVAAGHWDDVAQHCRIDLQTTVALARRMGVI